MSISLVAGLGNPGAEYEKTRHNVGFLLIDALARKHSLDWKIQRSFHAASAAWVTPSRTIHLVKPLTYMNESGRAIQAIAAYYKIQPADIAVIHDDINIDTGSLKISTQGSSGGQNGVASIIAHIGEDFNRFRIGIGPKSPPQIDIKDYVLAPFSSQQQQLINNQLEHFITGLLLLIEKGADHAMNIYNRKNLHNEN